ncbi:MAG: hypothetical protein U0Q19_07080 [Kineosporiaceae bacterium]
MTQRMPSDRSWPWLRRLGIGALGAVLLVVSSGLAPSVRWASGTARAVVTLDAESFDAEYAAVLAATRAAEPRGWSRVSRRSVNGLLEVWTAMYDPGPQLSLKAAQSPGLVPPVVTKTGVGYWAGAVDGRTVTAAMLALLGRQPSSFIATPDPSADAALAVDTERPSTVTLSVASGGSFVRATRQDELDGSRTYDLYETSPNAALPYRYAIRVDPAGRLEHVLADNAFDDQFWSESISYGPQHLVVPRADQLVTRAELARAREALALPTTVRAAARSIAAHAAAAARRAKRSPTVVDIRREARLPVGIPVRVTVLTVRNGVRVRATNPFTTTVSRVNVILVNQRIVLS